LGEVRILAAPLQPRNRLEHNYKDDEDPVYAIWRLPRRCRPVGFNNHRHGLHRSAAGDASGKPLRGLDPNLWFNNVELVASERIGRETVTYVSNIYKYYITYRLVSDQLNRREAAKAEVGKRK
jgi:hypothetical protein